MALLICAHGVRGGSGSAAIHADTLRRHRAAGEVAACCLKGRPSIAQALDALSASTIVVVPLLMANGYATQVLLPSAHREASEDRGRVILCPPIGMHCGLAKIIGARAAQACRSRGWATEEAALVLVGHGTNRNGDSALTAHRHAAALRRRRTFADVGVAFLDVPPQLPDALSRSGHRNAVVIGLFADCGVHGEHDVPRMLAMSFERSTVYGGPIGLAPELADLLLDQAWRTLIDVASNPVL